MNSAGFAYRQNKSEVEKMAAEDAERHNSYWNNTAALADNLKRLAEIIKDNPNKKIVLFLSPLHPLYRSHIKQDIWQKYFHIIDDLQDNANVTVVNCIHLFDERLEYFQDGDHLLPKGADLLSKQFDAIMGATFKKAEKNIANVLGRG